MSYEKTNWQDLPNTSTPINATRLNKMETGIADANGMIGVTTYSSNSTYAVGDYCVYNNKLYRCTTAITTGEAFNSSKWSETTVMNEKESVLNKVTSISSNSTNTQYPSAKAVYDQLVTKENLSNKTTSISSSSTDTQYPSAKAVNTELDKKQNNLEVSGQGTNITLNGTSKNKFKKFVVKGKTEQEQLTGKNILTETIYGYGINATDGTITEVSGRNARICQVSGNTTYYISRGAVGTASYFYYGFYDEAPANGVQPSTNNSFGNIGNTNPIVVTSPSSAKYLVVFMGTGTSTNVMVATTSNIDYEPYCRTEFQALIQVIRRLYIMLVGI